MIAQTTQAILAQEKANLRATRADLTGEAGEVIDLMLSVLDKTPRQFAKEWHKIQTGARQFKSIAHMVAFNHAWEIVAAAHENGITEIGE